MNKRFFTLISLLVLIVTLQNTNSLQAAAGEDIGRLEALAQIYAQGKNDDPRPEHTPRMILLHGPEGSDFIARAQAFAYTAGYELFATNGLHLRSNDVLGEGVRNIEDFFEQAMLRDKPCVLFIDEVDIIASFDAVNFDAGYNAAIQDDLIATLTKLFLKCDEFTRAQKGVVIFATNFAHRLYSRLSDRIELKVKIVLGG